MVDSKSWHTSASVSLCQHAAREFTDFSQERRLVYQVCICKSAGLGTIEEASHILGDVSIDAKYVEIS